MTNEEQRQYRIGMFLVALSALAWSTSGLFIRSITTDLMTMLFWRGIISGTSVFALFFALEGRGGWTILRKMRGPSFWAAVFSASSMITGIGSMYYAAIADSMVIYATGPFITVFVAFLTIGERPSRATILASIVALAGVTIMLADLAPGGSSAFGIMLAIIMTLTASGLTIVMRKHRDVAMLPAMASSAWLCSFSTFWFAAPLSVSAHNLMLIVAFGIVQNAMGLVLYTFGSRRIPAADASLLISLEVPFTPLWVWLILDEVPARATLIGGAIVLVALLSHIIYESRRDRTFKPIG